MCIKPVFWVDWVSGNQRYRVFDYAEKVYTPTATATGRASFSIDGGTGAMTFVVSSLNALTATTDGDVTIGLLTNRQSHLTGPRLEFFRQDQSVVRLAAVDSSGTLWVRDASEKAAVDGDSQDQFFLLDNAVIAPGAILANHFIEGTP